MATRIAQQLRIEEPVLRESMARRQTNAAVK